MNAFDKLVKFIKKGQIQKVSEILQSSTLNINQLQPKTGKGLIQIAMENLDEQMFNILLMYPGINTELPSKNGQTPLETAVILNNSYFVSKLLQTNINPRRKNNSGQTIFQVAIKTQTSQDILKRILNHKFEINQKVEHVGSLLNLAIISNQPENSIFLMKNKINLSISDDDDNTCLMLAVQKNKGDIVLSILQNLQSNQQMKKIQKQFFINSQNKQGNTALHIACLKNYQTIMNILQTRGAQLGIDVNLKNKKGQTPLDIKQKKQKQRLQEIELQKKRKQQKKIIKKQKQQEKLKQFKEEQRQKQQQKKRKKEEEILLMQKTQVQAKIQKNKTIWICAIICIALLGLMYLAILNSIQNKKANSI